MKTKHKINDVVYICHDKTKPNLLEVRLIKEIQVHINESGETTLYTLDNAREYEEKDVLSVRDVERLNKPKKDLHKF